MSKHTNRIPPALKHGIYSGIGLLPTEDPAEFQKFKQEIFDDYAPVGRSEKNIVDKIACLMWRSQNLSTYGVAMHARARHDSIYSKLNPPVSWPGLNMYEPETRSPEELEALRKSADERVRTELGAAIELVEIGDVATIEHLEKEIAIRERLDAMILRNQKSLLYVRGIKSMSSSTRAAPLQAASGQGRIIVILRINAAGCGFPVERTCS